MYSKSRPEARIHETDELHAKCEGLEALGRHVVDLRREGGTGQEVSFALAPGRSRK